MQQKKNTMIFWLPSVRSKDLMTSRCQLDACGMEKKLTSTNEMYLGEFAYSLHYH